MKKVLVTGGAGFLGSHLCDSLFDDGHKVICLDNFGSGSEVNISHLIGNKRFEVVKEDVRKPDVLPEVDEIYHLASRASPDDFTKYPVQIALTNTTGTRNLLEHAVDTDAKMLFASTSEVYGDPETHPQSESYTGNVNIRGPRGCYDESKRFGETLTVAYNEKYGIDVRTARIFNTYGPRMRKDDGRVVPNFITQALRGDNLTVYGDGDQTRSFCYVSDTVLGLRNLMEGEGLDGQVVNIGRENEQTINQLAKMIIEITNSESEIVYKKLPVDDPKRRCPDLTYAKNILDWDPNVRLRVGLDETVEYYRERLSLPTPQGE